MASTLTDANSDNPYVRLEGACTSQRRVYSLLSPLLLMLLLLLLRSPVRQQPALVSLGSNFGLPDSVVVVTEANVAAARERLRAALLANGGPNCHGQFSPHRYAFLFAPGSYDLDVEVGFYTQVAGLGRRPEDVTFTGRRGVHVDNCGPRPPAPHVGSPYADVGALDNFWRSAENLRVSGTLVWATSQAALAAAPSPVHTSRREEMLFTGFPRRRRRCAASSPSAWSSLRRAGGRRAASPRTCG